MKIRSVCLLSVLISFSACRTTEPKSEGKFGAGEHVLLGDQGYAKGCPGCPEKITRKDQKQSFTYGELVAFAGDFYDDAETLDNGYELDSAFRRLLDKNYDDVNLAKSAMNAEKKQIEDRQKVTDNNISYYRAFGDSYLVTSVCNVDHFGWQNMKRYVQEHSKALKIAGEGFKAKDPEAKKEFLRLALLNNAFADHFLTDGFASGHVRIPRLQDIKATGVTCPQTGKGDALGRKSGALIKILHDHDHNFAKSGGLMVQNSRGDSWKTRADGELHVASTNNDIHVALPIEAVGVSLTEIMDAFQKGVQPKGVYRATELVPFVDPREQTLAATFDPKMNIAEINAYLNEAGVLWSTFGSLQGVNEQSLRALFSNIPTLMKQFQSDVSSDVKANPELALRLPPAYIKGFERVQ